MRVSRNGTIIEGGRSCNNPWLLFVEARQTHKLQQDEVAEQIGVHPMAISAWERRKYPPARRHWDKIEKVLGIPKTDIATHAAGFSLPNNNSDL